MSETAIAIAVLTYKRPQDLEEIVPALLEEIKLAGYAVELLVVDNDPGNGASAQALRLGHGQHVRYIHEPRPGISAARNRAIEESQARRLLIFIDDDERPRKGWLASMIHAFDTWPCEAVIGRVEFEFQSELDPWIRAGGFFHREHAATGTVVATAASHNLLLDLDFVREKGLTFDERFGLTGGSDTLFTRQFTASGGRIIWCDEAIVIERVPSERSSVNWVMRRAFRGGNTRMRAAVAMETTAAGSYRARLRMAGQGVARLIGGSVSWGWGLVSRRVVYRARGARTVARGAGMVVGVVGWQYEEYRRP